MSTMEVRVPDMGDVKGVTVLDVLVKPGDKVAKEDPLISLESDKAAMDVPSPVSGVIKSIEIKKGAEVLSGTLIATVESDAPASAKAADAPAAPAKTSDTSTAPAGDPAPAKADAPPVKAAAPAPAKADAPAVKAASPAPAGAVDLVVLGAVSAAIRRHSARRT